MFERLVRERRFPVIKLQRKVLVRRSVLEAWLQGQEMQAASPPETAEAPDRLRHALATTRSPQASRPLEADDVAGA